MALSPIVEWRAATTPFAPVSSLALTGVGYSGAIPAGTASSVVTLRIYNNFGAVGSVVDALNCVLASYDDTLHQGVGTSAPVVGHYLTVQVMTYNASTTGADSVPYGVGGGTKHLVPVNGGTISGTGANYLTVQVQGTIPALATQGAVSQGLWLEYSATA